MLNKFITLSICIITLNSCSFSSQKTKDKLEGKYILIEGNLFITLSVSKVNLLLS